MSIFSEIVTLEENEELHLARILILLMTFAGKNGKGNVEGLTKLAKLDFLLRYPTCLERALEARNVVPSKANVADHERMSVESKMVRFRYGPWDFRYRKLINLLVGMGLTRVTIHGRTIMIGLTQEGLDLSASLSKDGAFLDMANRADLLKRHFNLSATNLMKFIYDTFPEISTLSLGEEINT